MKFPLIISLLVLFASCRESIKPAETTLKGPVFKKDEVRKLSYYKCDYIKNQYDTILMAGEENKITEVWGVNKNDITNLPKIPEQGLDTNSIVKSAESHLKSRFQDMSLWLSDFKIENISSNDTLNKRNYFIEVTFLYDKRGYYQVVPVLLDGRIILSNNE